MSSQPTASAQERWREEALTATCALAEAEADTVQTDYAAADAGANFVISQFIEPLVSTLESVELPPEAQASLDNAKALLNERFSPVRI